MTYETIITAICLIAAFAVVSWAFRPTSTPDVLLEEMREVIKYHGERATKWRARALRAEAALTKIEATIADCEAEVRS
ncbi:hypothetical protein ACH0BU_17920 [Sphingomonas olei]